MTIGQQLRSLRDEVDRLRKEIAAAAADSAEARKQAQAALDQARQEIAAFRAELEEATGDILTEELTPVPVRSVPGLA